MKSQSAGGAVNSKMSHPVRGAWIEIQGLPDIWEIFPSHPVRGAWIEILNAENDKVIKKSRTP